MRGRHPQAAMRFDLHLHSCLSPCGALEMSPRALVARARAAGLTGIALADHNSARNAPAFAACARAAGIAPLFGLEICTAEELHALAIFDSVAQALAMGGWIRERLPARPNVPEVFGDQPVVNAAEEIEEFEPRLLSAPTSASLPEVRERAQALGGLFVACHVDRPVFSFFSQLGVLAGNEGFDAMELSRHGREEDWRARTAPHPLLRSSDAHHLDDIGLVWSEADLPAFSVAALRAALRAGQVRLSPCLARTP